eukprot:scaffold65_cov353-Prasinococcus_capsulatus_cf.AAC.19
MHSNVLIMFLPQVICTISPAQSQLEMTRNTLLFAAHAKNVSNQATINKVVTKDALLRQYQDEIRRLQAMLKRGKQGTLEAELRVASAQRDAAEVRRRFSRLLWSCIGSKKLCNASEQRLYLMGQSKLHNLTKFVLAAKPGHVKDYYRKRRSWSPHFGEEAHVDQRADQADAGSMYHYTRFAGMAPGGFESFLRHMSSLDVSQNMCDDIGAILGDLPDELGNSGGWHSSTEPRQSITAEGRPQKSSVKKCAAVVRPIVDCLELTTRLLAMQK